MVIEEQCAQRMAICHVQSHYCVALDAGDFGLLERAFAEDAFLVSPSGVRWEGRRTIAQGLSAVRQELDKRSPSGAFQRHNLTTRFIDFDGQASANGLNYFIVITEIGLTLTGRYRDTYARAGGNWLIQGRVIEIDWVHADSRFKVRPS